MIRYILIGAVLFVSSCATHEILEKEKLEDVIRVQYDAQSGQMVFLEGDRPILQYNFKKVDVPEGLMDRVASASRQYVVPRANYIHPVYGPNGEELTRDWAEDHPHHRGIYWAWPEVDWQGKRGDLHALQHVFAIPDGEPVIRQDENGVTMTAHQIWTWEDGTEIVDETVNITVWRTTEQGNFIELEFDLTAREDIVQIARRGTNSYGGLNMRLSHLLGDDQITTFTENDLSAQRPTWGYWRGNSPLNDQVIGLAIIENTQNPDYPGEWVLYPDMPWFQPTFPKTNTRYTIEPDEILTLRYGLWLNNGELDQQVLHNTSWAYNAEGFEQPHQVPFDAFESILNYEEGQSRTYLIRLEQYIRQSPASMHHQIENALLHVLLHPEATIDAKEFVSRQLYVVGSEESVPELVKLLNHDELAHAARYALLANNGQQVDQKIRESLDRITDTNHLVGLIDLIGQRGNEESVSVISRFLEFENQKIVSVAINSMGLIGNEQAKRELLEADIPDELQIELGDALIRSVRDLPDLQQQELAQQLLSDEWPTTVRITALNKLFTLDAEEAYRHSIRWLDQGTMEEKRVAARLIGQYAREDVASSAQLEVDLEALEESITRLVINSAMQHSNRNLLSQIVNWIEFNERSIRITAIEALGRLGDQEHILALLPIAQESDNEEVAQVAKRTLTRVPGQGLSAVLLNMVDSSDSSTQSTILRVLADRHETNAIDTALNKIHSENRNVRHAAWYLLEVLADEQYLPDMLEALAQAQVEDLDQIGSALSNVSSRATNHEEVVNLIIASIDEVSAAKRVELLPVFAQLGGTNALNTVVKYTEDDTQPVREAAFRSLINWPSPEAIPYLIEVSNDWPTQELRWQAIHGTIRLLPQWTGETSEKENLLLQINDMFNVDEERVELLAILPDYASTITLELAVELYENYPSIRSEAESTIEKLALPDDEGRGGLWNSRTIELLEHVKETTNEDELQQRIIDYFIIRREMADRNLALNAPVTASSSEPPYTPDNVVNGEVGLDSYWSSDVTPAWVEIDLGEVYNINQTDVTFVWDGSRYYQFTIEVSLDSDAWTQVVDYGQEQLVSTREGLTLEFDPIDARYVRINILDSGDVHGAEVTGAHVVNISVNATN